MFSKIFNRGNLDEEKKRKVARIENRNKKSSLNPFLLDIFKARGLKHEVIKLKEKERLSKKFLEHCDFLHSIVTLAKIHPKDSEETKQAVHNIPVLLAASIQPSSADKYLREF